MDGPREKGGVALVTLDYRRGNVGPRDRDGIKWLSSSMVTAAQLSGRGAIVGPRDRVGTK